MIRSLLKRTKFHRAALPLLAMLLTTTTAWADVTPINVSYMKADGSTETHEAIPLDGSETTLSAGWYVVNSDITYDHNITISSAVTIILANGKTMNVGTSQQPLSSCYKAIGYSYASDNSALTIYGQSLDDSEAGHLNVYCTGYTEGISLSKSYTQHSGNVSVNAEAVAIRAETTFTVNGGTCKAITTGNPAAIYAHDANITGGTIVADGGMNSINAYAGNVTISGGKITATNRFDTFGSINATNVTLGWTNHDDYIKANSYKVTNGITIADGKMLFDGTDFYSGTLTNEQKNTIADKTLRPAASVSYVKADGTSGTHEATILTGNENELGSYDGTTWYVVKNTQDGVDVAHTGKVTLYGNVNIILEDGAEATFEGNDQEALWSTFGNIYIYGQSGQTGKLTANGRIAIDAVDTSEGQANIGIYGGIITASGISGIAAQGNITIAGGKVNATATGNDCEAIRTNKSVTISGGQVDATATGEQGIGIYSYSGNITITGGKINATATGNDVAAILASTSVTISSGKLDANADGEKATAIYVDDFTLTGGQVIITATGTDATGIYANAGITLGWTNPSDFINANNYEVTNGIIIAEGKMLGNGTYFYSGTLTNEQKSAIAGKTLRPAGYCGAADANEGKNVTWSVADNGDDKLKLTISKNETEGQENYAMAEYTTESPAPWANVAAIINEVVVGDGVTPSSTFPFDNLINLTAVTVPVSTLEDYLTNWSAKADVIKSTGKTNTVYIDDITWTLTKTNGDKIDGNFPLKLTFEGVGFMDSFGYGNTPWYAVHSYITEASLPDGLKQIGTYALTGCAITSITIPASVSSIEFAFADCPKLANVTFKGNIKEIGSNAFNGCTSLKEISLPNSVTKIGGNAFCRSGLTRITIPSLVSEIPMSAFSDCKSLAEVTIPEGVKIIDWAFDGCTSLTEISIPSSVTSIGQNSFYGCTSLKTVRINSTEATCHHLAFSGCDALERIIVPNAATIAKYLADENLNYYYGNLFGAEGYCGLSTENDGKNVKWSLMPIADETVNVSYDENNPEYRQAYALSITKNTDDENANLAIKDYPALDNWYDDNNKYSIYNRIKIATIEEGITNIGKATFNNCLNLETVAVPSTVTTIGQSAFYDCYKLACINIPEGVSSIGDETFNSCKSLTSIDIPSTVTSIGRAAFYFCSSLTNIVIPSNVKTIANSAFAQCRSLKTVRVMATTPPTINKYDSNYQYAPFFYCISLKNIFVPDVDAYSDKDAYGWNSTTEKNNIRPLLRADKTTLFAQNASNTYMTWCDEFEWKKPENCTVYTVSGVNSEQVQVAEVEGDVIPAYTPVLIKRAESELESDLKAEFSNVKEPRKENGWILSSIWYTLCDDNGITPTYGYNSISYNNDNGVLQADAKYNNNYSIFFYGNTGAVKDANTTGNIDQYEANYVLYGDKLMLVDTDNGIPVNRCVLKVSYKPGGAVCSRSLTIGVGGDTTGMEELKNEKIEELNSEWYDLQGRRLDSKPTKKGLYINNGKKIVIK